MSLPRLMILVTAWLAFVPATASAASRTYIVMLDDPPVASYDGGTRGIAPTSPKATGARHVNSDSAPARAYDGYLDGRQRAALDRAGGDPKVLYSYRTAFAGFAARLTPQQRSNLRRAPQVARVFINGRKRLQTVASDETALDAASGFGDSAAYLGLPAGLWNQLGGSEMAGKDVIVGVLDSGITPQHPSFADKSADGYVGPDYGPPPARFTGACDPGQDPKAPTAAAFCNDKLIGARYFLEGFGAEHLAPDSFVSPRDDDGHGTHTASTAAGNFGVDPSIKGNDLGVNLISGIAPRARVAAYKVCWVGGDVADGCTDADSVAAVDAAVADGVDVINYSVGGSTSNVIDATEYAFLGASDANVFVANSAGNDGPGPGTVGTPTTVPWLTSVAANNPARTFAATATITPPSGPALTVTGASVTGALPAAAPLVDAFNVAGGGATGDEAELCLPGSLDPARVAGKVVLCRRGQNARIEKSEVVRDAGGVGMILYNPQPGQDTDTDIHYVPSVHVSNADGLRIKAAIASGPTTAAISAGAAALGEPKVLAAFSSRGPQTAVPDLAKPDVTAPGVNILAGNTPDPAASTGLPAGELFQSISGTSMSSPHVAGAAALLRQQHPGWDPAVIKSALMLTADSDVKAEDGVTPASPFDAGSGEIDPTSAGAAKLVLDETTGDYLRYLSGVDPADFGDIPDPIDPSDLNLASIAASKVAGTFTTTRTFTSTDTQTRRWTVSVDVPGFATAAGAGESGFATFNVDPGQTVDVSLLAQRTEAPLYRFSSGEMTLDSAGQTLHVPVSLRPVAIKAPDPIQVDAEESDGTFDFPVRSGFEGQLSLLGWGLAAPAVNAGQQIGPSPTGNPDAAGTGQGNTVFDVNVPAGAQLLSGRLGNVTDGSDLDLFAYHDDNGDGAFSDDELFDFSASAGSDESLDEVFPPKGAYRFVVVGFTTVNPASAYDLSTWVVNDGSPDDPGNAPGLQITGDPFTVGIGDTVTPTIEYSGVDDAGLYLGVATYHDSASPTRDNLLDGSVIELSKLTDTTSGGDEGDGGGEPGPTPTPEPTPEPPAGKPKPTAKVLKAKLSRNRRKLKLRLDLNRRAKVKLRIERRGKRYAGAKERSVRAGRSTERFRLSRKLRKGTYRVILKLRAGDQRNTATVRIRVRK